MARVRVTAEVHIRCSAVVNQVYRAGFEGPAPDDHIERIVAAGKGVRLSRRGETVAGRNPDSQKKAGDHDA